MESDERKPDNKPNKFKKTLLAPVAGIHRLTGRLLGDDDEVTEDDILSVVDAAGESGAIEDSEVQIINNVLEFDDLTVSDVMTHRTNVVGVRADTSLDDVISIALETGFSRLPVYGENLDDITGIIIVKDLLKLIGKPDLSDFSLGKFSRKAEFIPDSGSCTVAFKKMKEEKASMAVVVDEYGGTAGIVTMEDLIEEVLGNIEDEYDKEENYIEKIENEKYKINGEADPEEVLKLFGHKLPDNHEYETLAGFVTDLLGFIPEDNETPHPHVDYKDLRFVAVGIEQFIVFKNKAVLKKDEEGSKEKERR
jgi:putative hemolysin